MSRKLVALFLGVMLVFVALAIDITYVNATKGEKYERQVLSQTQQSYDSRTIPFQRGSITDRNGTIQSASGKNNVACWSTVLEKAIIKWNAVYQD